MQKDLVFLSAMSTGVIIVGSKVRVKKSVAEPRYGWGGVSHSSVGTVASIDSDGDFRIEFPGRSNTWTGAKDEIELASGSSPAAVAT
eukprot:SAG11_NODE_9319_length_922_cov_1.029162_2_plen_86_part_01